MFTFRRLGLRQKGFALVVVLTAVVLITVIVLAFFSRAILNRQVSFTSTNEIKSDMLARSALDIVLGEVRQEIVDYSYPATNGILRPLSATNMVPAKTGVSGADSNFGAYSIAKIAAENTKIEPGNNGKTLGSSVTLNTRSHNGRTLSQWFSNGPKLGTANLPVWTYLTRNGTIATSLSASAKDIAGTNFVTGRFSYTVYNIGGLLDANIAGHPQTISATNVSSKSSIAYADLTVLGLTPTQIDNLVAWRNAVTAATPALFNTWAGSQDATNTPASILAASTAAGGYLNTALGDNSFFSRRDLLRYLSARANTNAAPYLTHLSRSCIAPSWSPQNITNSSVAYGDIANDAASINRFIPAVSAFDGLITDYSDKGVATTRKVTTNEPLIASRFSLAKLAWIGHEGANDSAFSSTLSNAERLSAIKTSFGLSWNGSKKQWDYNHGKNDEILTLDEVRKQERAPDFFELLKAGILQGSLGQEPGAAATTLTSDNPADKEGPMGGAFDTYSKNIDRQVLQIGANIIDQADPDNFPTAIYFRQATKYNEDDLYNTVFGVENLPVLHRMITITCFLEDHVGKDGDDPADPSDDILPAGPMGVWIQPELWNPHDSSTATNAPTKLRIVTYGGCYIWNPTDDATRAKLSTPIDFGTDINAPSIDGTIYFKNPAPNSTSPPPFFDNPVKLTGYEAATEKYEDTTETSGAKNRYPFGKTKQKWNVYFNHNEFMAIWLGEVYRDPSSGAFNIKVFPQNYLTFVLEYYDGSNWLPYSVMSRIEQLAKQGYTKNTRYGKPTGRAGAGHPDPRTDRFSAAGTDLDNGGTLKNYWMSEHTILSTPNTIEPHDSSKGGKGTVFSAWPRRASGFYPNPNATNYFLSDWAQNLPTSTFRYENFDKITRPGDSWRADFTTGDGVMLYHKTAAPVSAARRRPLILNRPFQSVGELGYAFRDEPFKTLDFWSSKSADAGLLDLFRVSSKDSNITAGSVNVNTAPPAVLEAILQGTIPDALTTNTLAPPNVTAIAQNIAKELSTAGPLLSPAELATQLSDSIYEALTNNATNTAFQNKRLGEAPIRTLANLSDTRTWNLMIDIVAQPGRLAAGSDGLEDFIVEGEKRYWLHVAVDRYSGKIISQQIESVYE